MVSRNELENNILEGFALQGGIRLEVKDVNGPVTLIMGSDKAAINAGVSLTARYSDAPRGERVWVKVTSDDSDSCIQGEAADKVAIESLRIKDAKIRKKTLDHYAYSCTIKHVKII